MFIAPDADGFRRLFIERLRQMLLPDRVGAFILVLANSLQDENLRRSLRADLDATFAQLLQRFRAGELEATADDLAVFSALCEIGMDSLGVWRTRTVSDWELNFNQLRALRPARASAEKVVSIEQVFNPAGFNFNKAFLRPEILWQAEWRDVSMRVLYNKFPFAPWHLIIVPEPEKQLPQYLDETQHARLWALVECVQDRLPGFAAGYNSIGACASVNQLHFQSFVREHALPLELPHWRHNGGGDAYPMVCAATASVSESWALLRQLHADNQPYNLLYRPGRCYVLQRRMQGSDSIEPLVRGAGWIEECGVFNIAEPARFDALGADELTRCIESLSV
jgi:diadenosine tetraphosphate (Ap4A) HIT family hydrolase